MCCVRSCIRSYVCMYVRAWVCTCGWMDGWMDPFQFSSRCRHECACISPSVLICLVLSLALKSYAFYRKAIKMFLFQRRYQIIAFWKAQIGRQNEFCLVHDNVDQNLF